MKNIIITCFSVSVLLMASCTSNETSNQSQDSATSSTETGGATITFDKNTYDFGKIKEGEKVSYQFKFVNKGTEPLIISEATASCGCTVPEYSKDPIAPGKTGQINVVFDSTGKPGMQHKVVTISSNAKPGKTELFLTGEVQAKPSDI